MAMTLADLIKDFIDTSKERLKNPISGAFLCSFLIWNWQPIILLVFSKQPIEDRIQIIDQYFYKPSAVIFPILISFFYLIIIPAIMIVLDWILVPMKRARTTRIYQEKEFVIFKKIQHADLELTLKNAESGNKTIEDLKETVSYLEETNSQIIEANKNTVDQLNFKLKEANDSLRKLVGKSEANIGDALIDVQNKSQKMYFLSKLANHKLFKEDLSATLKEQILSIDKFGTGVYDFTKIDDDLFNLLKKAGLVITFNTVKTLTAEGKEYLDYLSDRKKL